MKLKRFRFRREYDWRNKETSFVIITVNGTWSADRTVALLREELHRIMVGLSPKLIR